MSFYLQNKFIKRRTPALFNALFVFDTDSEINR